MKRFSIRFLLLGAALIAGALTSGGSPFSPALPGSLSLASRGGPSVTLSTALAAERALNLSAIKRAHIISRQSEGAFDSYQTDACIFPGSDVAAGKNPKSCVHGRLGIRTPSSAFLMIASGNASIVEMSNAIRGWRITASPNSIPPQTTTTLGDTKLGVLKEQIAHSLVALLGLLNNGSKTELSRLELAGTSTHLVVTWVEGPVSNKFFFPRRGLLCDKQVRTTSAGVTVLNYTRYQNVNGVMLPYRIQMEGPSGSILSTEVVDAWTLGVNWPDNFFTPEGFRR